MSQDAVERRRSDAAITVQAHWRSLVARRSFKEELQKLIHRDEEDSWKLSEYRQRYHLEKQRRAYHRWKHGQPADARKQGQEAAGSSPPSAPSSPPPRAGPPAARQASAPPARRPGEDVAEAGALERRRSDSAVRIQRWMRSRLERHALCHGPHGRAEEAEREEEEGGEWQLAEYRYAYHLEKQRQAYHASKQQSLRLKGARELQRTADKVVLKMREVHTMRNLQARRAEEAGRLRLLAGLGRQRGRCHQCHAHLVDLRTLLNALGRLCSAVLGLQRGVERDVQVLCDLGELVASVAHLDRRFSSLSGYIPQAMVDRYPVTRLGGRSDRTARGLHSVAWAQKHPASARELLLAARAFASCEEPAGRSVHWAAGLS